jgi:hypothetical protein
VVVWRYGAKLGSSSFWWEPSFRFPKFPKRTSAMPEHIKRHSTFTMRLKFCFQMHTLIFEHYIFGWAKCSWSYWNMDVVCAKEFSIVDENKARLLFCLLVGVITRLWLPQYSSYLFLQGVLGFRKPFRIFLWPSNNLRIYHQSLQIKRYVKCPKHAYDLNLSNSWSKF